MVNKLSQKKICSITISFLVAIMALFLALTAILVSELKLQTTYINKAYTFVRSIVDDGNSALYELNGLNFQTCDRENLTAMQQVLFKSNFLKEIGFLQDGYVICTTSSGILSKPVLNSDPTYITPRKIKVITDHPLILFKGEDNPLSTVIVEHGLYNVVIHSGYLNHIGIQLNKLQIIYQDEKNTYHIYGTQGIFENKVQIDEYSNFTLHKGLYSHICDRKLGYCAATNTSISQLLTSNRVKLIGIIIFVITLFSWVLKKTYPFTTRISSIKYRTKTGIDANAFYPTYQPIVDLTNESIVGCEVLGRFRDKYGSLKPDQFIPLLKEHGLTWHYTVHQINRVLSEIKELDLPTNFKLGFNIFPEDLISQNITELISIAKPFLSTFEINFEIVEDQVLDEFEAKKQIHKLADEGFSISIDDFGTGYSNLGQLESIRCHYLKIDRQFIGDIEKGSLLSSLVPQISEIANRFELACIAEGIENNQQKELLLKQGITLGQGWYFGKPMSITQWSKFIKTR